MPGYSDPSCVVAPGRNHHLKSIAYQVVAKARRARRRTKEQPAARCERCRGSDGVLGHHDDYAAALDTIDLCRSCHRWRHKELRSGTLTPRARLGVEYRLSRARRMAVEILVSRANSVAREAERIGRDLDALGGAASAADLRDVIVRLRDVGAKK